MSAQELITDHLDLWTSAVTAKSTAGRGRNGKIELTGIKKLRELILELAVRGKLVEQDPSDEPAGVLLERIAKEKARLVKEGKIKKPKKLKQNPDGYAEPFEIPDNWRWAPIDQLAPIPLFDGDWIESKDQDPSGTIRLLQLADVGVGKFKNTSRKYINTETFLRLKCSKLNAGDILIARLPSPIGRAAIFPGLYQDCITAVDVAILRTVGVLDDNYVVYAINSTTSRNQVESYGKGATRFRISTGNLKTILVPVPPLPEQHRIVEKVDELMALCDHLEQQVGDQLEAHEVLVDTLLDALTRSADAAEVAENWARLAEHFDTLFTTEASIDKLKQTILQLAVMGRLVPQDSNDEPASVLLERIADEKARLVKEGKIKKQKRPIKALEKAVPYKIPASWSWACFDEISLLVTSGSRGWKAFYADSGTIFIRSQDIKHDKLIFDGVAFVSLPEATEGSRTRVSQGDILITITGANVAKAALVDQSLREAYVSQHVALVRLTESATALGNYIHMWLTATHGGRRLLLESSYGAKPGLNLKNIKELLIPLPPVAERNRIIEKVDELMTLCDHLKARLGEASETRTRLAEAVVEQAVR